MPSCLTVGAWTVAGCPSLARVCDPWRPVRVEPAWRTAAVVALARAVYEEGRWAELPVLADALEEAGCADVALLGHLRGPGPHARGCWALDLLLTRE